MLTDDVRAVPKSNTRRGWVASKILLCIYWLYFFNTCGGFYHNFLFSIGGWLRLKMCAPPLRVFNFGTASPYRRHIIIFSVLLRI